MTNEKAKREETINKRGAWWPPSACVLRVIIRCVLFVSFVVVLTRSHTHSRQIFVCRDNRVCAFRSDHDHFVVIDVAVVASLFFPRN